MWQDMAKCGKLLQNVATRAHSKQNMTTFRNLWPCCENPFRPDPVWKPVTKGVMLDKVTFRRPSSDTP